MRKIGVSLLQQGLQWLPLLCECAQCPPAQASEINQRDWLFDFHLRVRMEEGEDVLAQILARSNSILAIALTCPTGVRSIPSPRATSAAKTKRTSEERRTAELIRWANHERRLLNEVENCESVLERKKTIL